MIKLGLTGGIGSGKTTVAKRFEALGIPVYYADDKAKEIMLKNPAVKEAVIRLLGAQAYKDNQLNVSYIGGMVFDNPHLLKALEAIVHPAVRKDFIDWVGKQKGDYVMVENAILHKTGMDQLVDYIITVTASQQNRLKRLQKRDGKSEEFLKKIMENQENEAQLLKKSDFIIDNSTKKQDLNKKISKINDEVKNMLKKS